MSSSTSLNVPLPILQPAVRPSRPVEMFQKVRAGRQPAFSKSPRAPSAFSSQRTSGSPPALRPAQSTARSPESSSAKLRRAPAEYLSVIAGSLTRAFSAAAPSAPTANLTTSAAEAT